MLHTVNWRSIPGTNTVLQAKPGVFTEHKYFWVCPQKQIEGSINNNFTEEKKYMVFFGHLGHQEWTEGTMNKQQTWVGILIAKQEHRKQRLR